MFLKRLVIILFIFCFNSGYTQTWEQLETEYNTLLNNKKNDSALIKSKEIYSWVKVNEGDTSLNLPISLKLIGNAFMNINKDSAIHYYNLGINVLNKQNRDNNIQASKILYNKATIYYDLKNDSIALILNLKSIEVLEKLNFTEYPFCVYPLNRVMIFYSSKGYYKKAESYILKALDIRKKVLGEEHPDYANSLNDLGFVYENMGDYKKAEPYFIQALAIRKKVLGEEHLDYAVSLNNLGNVYFDMGDYKITETYFLQSMAIRKKVLGEEHPDYAVILSNLGLLYIDMGDSKKAEPYFLQALAIQKKVLGEEHPNYASSINNIGYLYSYMGDYKKAESYILKALDIQKKVLGEEHPDYANSLNELGIVYENMDDYKKAEPFYLQALAIQKKVLGEENSSYAKSLNNLGILYSHMGDYKKAEPFYLQALAIQKKVFGEEHPDYAFSLNSIGNLYCKIGDYKKAEPYYLKAFAIRKKVIGEEHLDYARSLSDLGNLYINMYDYKKAELYLLKSLEVNKKVLGEEHPDYATSINNLGNLYFNMGTNRSDTAENKKAESYFLQALAIRKKVIGEEHLDYAASLNILGILYSYKGDSKKAEPYFLQALAIRKKVLGEEHPNYADILYNIGDLYMGVLYKGDYKKAEPYFLQALAIQKKVLGEEHPVYASIFISLAMLYSNMGDYKKAEHYYSNYFHLNKKIINKNFAWLSEKQKEASLVNEEIFYSILNKFSTQNNLKYSSFIGLVFDGNLFSKSLLLETSIDSDKALANTKDEGVKNNFEQLKSTRRLYTKLESEGSDKIDLIKKLNIEADSLDKILVNSIDEFRPIKDRFNINWQNIQSNLSSDEAAIEFAKYFDFEDSAYHYMGLIVKQGDKYPQLIKLCSEYELKQNSPETELNVLYDLVWKPLLPSLTNIKTIYYSPSGLLNNIPFQALYKKENGQIEYVMDKFTLHQLTSTRYLALGLKKKEQEPIQTSIALFGGINYNDYPNALADTTNHNESSEAAFLYKNAIVQNRNIDSTRTGAKYLPGTKKEVETIANVLNAKQWNIDISEGKNATENKLKSLSGNNSKAILHIATHGFAFPNKEEKIKGVELRMMNGNDKYNASDNPMIRSGLLFGGANMTWQGKGDSLLNTTNEDGVLTAYELSQLDLSNTKLAVLSACETGKGEIQGSEGTFGLKRALKLAGVDNMIVSLWKVPDDATMEMMTLFYTELAKTKLPVPAFEFAQKTMRNKYLNEPKKWAGFVFVR